MSVTERLIYRDDYAESVTSDGVHYIEIGEFLTFDEIPRAGPNDDPQTPRRQLETLRGTNPALYDSVPEVKRLLGNCLACRQPMMSCTTCPCTSVSL